MKSLLLWAAKYDFWSLLSLIILVVGAIAGFMTFYWPRRSIKNLTIGFRHERAGEEWNYPSRILIIFANDTGKNIHIASASFKYKDLRPDRKTLQDGQTGKSPIYFPMLEKGGTQPILQGFECYLDTEKRITHSYAPIDPDHTDEEVRDALIKGKAGSFNCFVTLLPRDNRPVIRRLKVKAKNKSA